MAVDEPVKSPIVIEKPTSEASTVAEKLAIANGKLTAAYATIDKQAVTIDAQADKIDAQAEKIDTLRDKRRLDKKDRADLVSERNDALEDADSLRDRCEALEASLAEVRAEITELRTVKTERTSGATAGKRRRGSPDSDSDSDAPPPPPRVKLPINKFPPIPKKSAAPKPTSMPFNCVLRLTIKDLEEWVRAQGVDKMGGYGIVMVGGRLFPWELCGYGTSRSLVTCWRGRILVAAVCAYLVVYDKEYGSGERPFKFNRLAVNSRTGVAGVRAHMIACGVHPSELRHYQQWALNVIRYAATSNTKLGALKEIVDEAHYAFSTNKFSAQLHDESFVPKRFGAARAAWEEAVASGESDKFLGDEAKRSKHKKARTESA